LNWGVLESEDIDSIEELFNDVQLSLNHGYQKNAGMVGTGYMLAMTSLEKASELTNGVVMLNGLSMATAKNEEIRDILTQINIETGCYDSVCSHKFWLVKATLETCLQVHMMNQQLRDNLGLHQRMQGTCC